MTFRYLFALTTALPVLASAQRLGLSYGQVITHSAKVARGTLLRSNAPDGKAVVTIHGKGIAVDFQGATIRSQKDVMYDRENLLGTGLLIEDSEDVVVKNAVVHGFRFNILIRNSKNVRIEGCDVGYSRAIRMMHNGQPIDTFLNLRDSNAWREYGAGVWIQKAQNCRIDGTKGSGGTIGAALVDCDGCTVHGSDFSFCGGWGIALARTRNSVIAWNHLDFNNRVWAGGWGADAAAMGIADDCDDNFVVGNSMTHGGDGFFLSNRNDVGPVVNGVLTPEGGSDRNVVAYNDGSWSPANAFEGTFSVDNVYYQNLANDSGYGFWLGFSSDTKIIENDILRNRNGGIAIEHGKGNQIIGNRLIGNADSAIHLWANPAPERKPFPSEQIDLYRNVIKDSPWAYRLEGSYGVSARQDSVTNAKIPSFEWGTRPGSDAKAVFESSPLFRRLQAIEKTEPHGFRFYRETGLPTGVEWIQPDEYGPRDFRGRPVVYRMLDPGSMEIRLVAPGAMAVTPTWVATKQTKSSLSVTVKPEGDVGEDRPIQIPILVNGKRAMVVSAVMRTVAWDRRWFSWKGMTYDDQAAWQKLFAGAPLLKERTKVVDGEWSGRAPTPSLPRDHFAFVATTKVRMKAGRYAFDTLSDDGIRFFVDGKLVIDRWNHHGATPDEATLDLSAGAHDLRIEYCQEDGGAVLRLDWRKV